MTRKHYVAIAKAISETKYNFSGLPQTEVIWEALEELEERLAEFFLEENENFDALRFYAACSPYEAA
jgi:hypothetical protein